MVERTEQLGVNCTQMAPEPSTSTEMPGGENLSTAADDDDDLDSESQGSIPNILRKGNVMCFDPWMWSHIGCPSEVILPDGPRKETAFFHPQWSNGTAGVRANRPLTEGGVHYWEIHVGERVFGTSLMFGISTEKARLQTSEFKSILGENSHGWGLSHRGRIHHNGVSRYYCKPFTEYTPVVIGILVDLDKGEMSYFKDGVALGLAFTGLNEVEDKLYPTCSSTAAKTIMRVGRRQRSFMDLQDRCRQVIATRLRQNSLENLSSLENVVEELPLPRTMKKFVASGLGFTDLAF